jgi:hypothetical protein
MNDTETDSAAKVHIVTNELEKCNFILTPSIRRDLGFQLMAFALMRISF